MINLTCDVVAAAYGIGIYTCGRLTFYVLRALFLVLGRVSSSSRTAHQPLKVRKALDGILRSLLLPFFSPSLYAYGTILTYGWVNEGYSSVFKPVRHFSRNGLLRTWIHRSFHDRIQLIKLYIDVLQPYIGALANRKNLATFVSFFSSDCFASKRFFKLTLN